MTTSPGSDHLPNLNPADTLLMSSAVIKRSVMVIFLKENIGDIF